MISPGRHLDRRAAILRRIIGDEIPSHYLTILQKRDAFLDFSDLEELDR